MGHTGLHLEVDKPRPEAARWLLPGHHAVNMRGERSFPNTNHRASGCKESIKITLANMVVSDQLSKKALGRRTPNHNMFMYTNLKFMIRSIFRSEAIQIHLLLIAIKSIASK